MADILSLSEARKRREWRKMQERFKAGSIHMPTSEAMRAWLSKEHQAVMSPYPPALPRESVPADLIEMPSDVEPIPVEDDRA